MLGFLGRTQHASLSRRLRARANTVWASLKNSGAETMSILMHDLERTTTGSDATHAQTANVSTVEKGMADMDKVWAAWVADSIWQKWVSL